MDYHKNKILKKLPEFWKKQDSHLEIFIGSIAEELDELMMKSFEVGDQHGTETAENVHLDKIGKIWGITRETGETDSQLRVRIKSHVLSFVGGGNLKQLSRIADFYLGPGNYTFTESAGYMNVTVSPDPTFEQNFIKFTENLDRYKAAGVIYEFEIQESSAVVEEDPQIYVHRVSYTNTNSANIIG